MKIKNELPSEVDLECNYAFLLSEFNDLWSKSPKEHTKFAALKNKATNALMTFRQKDGIIERCNHVINGTYGNTKRPEHYEQSKTTK